MSASRVIQAWLLSSIAVCSGGVSAAEIDGAKATDRNTATRDGYQLQAGDVLEISVWKEADLQREVLIRPDGSFTFPLAGEVDARGKTVDNVRSLLVERLQRFVPTPVVTVAVKQIGGNRIYVLGKVVHAGDFALNNTLDVMQAISLAGGVTPYAAVNDIVILRRQNGRQQAFSFHYSDVARGRNLAQNIQLESGDTVVVP
jgi:polysaccharide export outer membrane protein